MDTIGFIVTREQHRLLSWVQMHQAFGGSHLVDLLLQAQVVLWLQMTVVVVGTAWCIALASTLCFGGWYAYTHPTTGNDRVIRRLTRLLWFLTFGLTDNPSSPVESIDSSQQGGHAQDEMLRSSGRF